MLTLLNCLNNCEKTNNSSNAEDTTAVKCPLRDHVINVGDVKTTMTIRGLEIDHLMNLVHSQKHREISTQKGISCSA